MTPFVSHFSSKPFQVVEPVLEPVQEPFLQARQISLELLRLDLSHPLVNGNKWFKLKLNLQAAVQSGHQTVLSFGGAYSNHLYALAAASAAMGLDSIGVIRGELASPLNPILQFAHQQGMQLHPVSRSAYRLKQTAEFITEMKRQFGDVYLIPEGGNNEYGVRGCEEIVDHVFRHPTTRSGSQGGPCYLAAACGTGATLAGLIRGVDKRQIQTKVLGVAVLKGAGFLEQEVARWLDDKPVNDPRRWRIEPGYHFGGYARQTNELSEFIERFMAGTGIPIEPVYTGKLLFGLYDLIKQGVIPAGSRVVAVHTGGVHRQLA